MLEHQEFAAIAFERFELWAVRSDVSADLVDFDLEFVFHCCPPFGLRLIHLKWVV